MAALTVAACPCPSISAVVATSAGKSSPARFGSLSASRSSSLLACSSTQILRASTSVQYNKSRGASSISCKVSVGDVAPAVSLKDQDGRSVSLKKFRGKNIIFYFYPQAETPGCTKQACAFRDSYADFKKLGAEVVGVSGDAPEALKAFKQKYNLPYTLLSDEDNEVRKEWGVPGDLFGFLPGRQTYVINKKGVVEVKGSQESHFSVIY